MSLHDRPVTVPAPLAETPMGAHNDLTAVSCRAMDSPDILSKQHDDVTNYGQKWLLFGSFKVAANGPGTVPDFSPEDAVPCTCASIGHSDESLEECKILCSEFVTELGRVSPEPYYVKAVHWKGRHVVMIGPIANEECQRVAISVIEGQCLQSKAQFIIMPDDPGEAES